MEMIDGSGHKRRDGGANDDDWIGWLGKNKMVDKTRTHTHKRKDAQEKRTTRKGGLNEQIIERRVDHEEYDFGIQDDLWRVAKPTNGNRQYQKKQMKEVNKKSIENVIWKTRIYKEKKINQLNTMTAIVEDKRVNERQLRRMQMKVN